MSDTLHHRLSIIESARLMYLKRSLSNKVFGAKPYKFQKELDRICNRPPWFDRTLEFAVRHGINGKQKWTWYVVKPFDWVFAITNFISRVFWDVVIWVGLKIGKIPRLQP